MPRDIQRAILTLKVEHPALRPHEIATICGVRFGRRPSPHTVRRILAEDPPPILVGRRYPPYHQITDPAARRLAVIHLHAEGWSVTSIAEYSQVDRHTVYDALKRWIAEGVAGLADKSHARRDGVRKVDLATLTTVKQIQENPELGAWRMHAALRQLDIHLSPRTCGRIMALNRKLYGLAKFMRDPHTPKPMPFAAQYRHQYWTVDIRHLDMTDIGTKVYCISILENYSRAILASGLFPTQELASRVPAGWHDGVVCGDPATRPARDAGQ